MQHTAALQQTSDARVAAAIVPVHSTEITALLDMSGALSHSLFLKSLTYSPA